MSSSSIRQPKITTVTATTALRLEDPLLPPPVPPDTGELEAAMVVVVLAGGVGPAGGAGDWSDVLALDVVVVEAVLVLVVVVVVVMRTEQSSGLGPRQPAAATHWALQFWPR